MSELPNGLVWGYHGTSSVFAKKHLTEGIPVTNFSGDWLGHGAYFWEGDYDRAEEWARLHAITKYGGTPIVFQAVIDLNNCLDLTLITDRRLLEEVVKEMCDEMPLEKRQRLKQNYYTRELDCGAINNLVQRARKSDGSPQFTTVRGAFREGDPVYRTSEGLESGVCNRDHIQINVIQNTAIHSLEIV
ncbi:hypothetical protein SDC9_76613 [bioreactor metagenome]|uniref:DUF3990 domain-containing protein n=1 Tax=bioreactor metagenome TaxID=1076179 RepID=A0A644YQD0_9ZZZZ